VVANTSRRLDLNLASRDELMTLPGISRDIADRIIAGRPWRRLDDLAAVSGIGPARIEALRDRVVFE
jgi:competence protein ComEA